MNSHATLRAVLFGLLASLWMLGCADGEFRADPVVRAPTNEVEALAVSDEDYDYAAVFANSGRGIIPP